MKTALQLKTDIINHLWPSGAPENLTTPVTGETLSAFDKLFQEGLAEICKWVDGEQQNHVDVVPFCATWYKCGVTVIPAPKGKIRRVGTIITDTFCNPVWFRQVEHPGPEWVGVKAVQAYLQAETITEPTPTLPLGFARSASTTDAACRSQHGVWSIYKRNMYLAPWIQSTESVLIHWDGLKNEWADADLVTDTQEYRKAALLYFQYAYEYYYGSMEKARLIHDPVRRIGTFDEALADLMYQDQEESKLRNTILDPDTREVIQDLVSTTTDVDETSYVLVTDTVTGGQYRISIADGQLTLTPVV